MRAPATRQRLLRQILVAVLDAPAPKAIRIDDERGSLDVRFDCDSAADAHALAKALRLRDQREHGQPHPLNTTPECWSGYLRGTLLGWHVQIGFDAPFTGEYIDRWRAKSGFTTWPATAAVLDQPDPCPADQVVTR
ncbi:hypothetical protein ABT297_04260 [Dactylosporangium sp. NPDC000555]|uniref:hypothetical protein n=1 Tax=Dactylosporangium sp. NPDC000555 TaxID=3154260 RepID=UPI0033296037